jgi:benzoyl-CoA reductase/2-hydroxyglutaryl-CoA dehydratase subunit BcrC/BadD/HgdB
MHGNLTIPSRKETIERFQAEQGRIAAVLPIHSPRALLRAFGFLPVEVWGPPRVDPSQGAAHVQAYVCSIARNALSFVLSGGLEVADLILVPHACDSLQGLGSLLLDFLRPQQPVSPLYLPRGRGTSGQRFLVEELKALYRELVEMTGEAPTEGELMDCIRREEAADARLAELHRCRQRLPLTQLELYRLIRAREYLPAESFSSLAEEVLIQANDVPEKRGTPVLLSGIVPEPMELFEALDEMGAWVAADDLACCGRRLYPPGEGEDPFQRLAGSLLSATPDAMNGGPIAARLKRLTDLAKAGEARGVIFYDVKFCEPELFDLPLLRQGLQQAGLRSLSLEVDLGDRLSQQSLTRLEAFLETIQ